MLVKRLLVCVLLAGLIISINSCKKTSGASLSFISTTVLDSFPSASAIEYYNDQLYIFGDDASHLLVLDTNYQVRDTVRFLTDTSYRIAKETKPDIESAAILKKGTTIYLYGFGSMSSPARKVFFCFPLSQPISFKRQNSILTDTTAIEELNIEGAAFINGDLYFSNRANTTHTINKIIKNKFHLNQFGIASYTTVSVQEIHLPTTKSIAGISGLYYEAEKDLLLFTASEENTPNAIDDGAIGESYLGFIPQFSRQKAKIIRVEKMLKLSEVSTKFQNQKIESLCVQRVMGDKMVLHLAADNDNGKSALFKLICRFDF
jgi:hypothetical protein